MPSDEKQYMLDRIKSHTWTVLHEGQLVPFYSWEVPDTAVNDSNDLEKLRFFPLVKSLKNMAVVVKG